jgi:hypothetical protein
MNLNDLFESGGGKTAADPLQQILDDDDAATEAEEARAERDARTHATRRTLLSMVPREMEVMEVQVGLEPSHPDVGYLVTFAKGLGIESPTDFRPWLRTVAALASKAGYTRQGISGVAAYLKEAEADSRPPVRLQ